MKRVTGGQDVDEERRDMYLDLANVTRSVVGENLNEFLGGDVEL